jgi:4-amino-4-deoxy-L-arabinose transferase-like glycosyltransferase
MRRVVDRDSADSDAVTSVSARRLSLGRTRRILNADPFLLAIVGIAGGLRFWRLGTQSFWYDEFVTVQVASRPLRNLFDAIANHEGSPPLYFLLSWGWMRVFGDGDVALRSLSTVAGVLTIPIVYFVARELGQSLRTSRVAALLAATNPLLIWYSQEARPYSLLVCLAAASLLWCARAANRGRWRDFLLWALWSALALSTHYFAFFFVAVEAVWIFIAQRNQWRRLAITCSLLGAACVAAVPFALQQRSTNQQKWIAAWPLGVRLKEAGRAALLGPGAPYEALWLPAAALVAVAPVVLALRGDRSERHSAGVLAAVAGAAIALPLIVSLGRDHFLGRNVIASLVPFLIAAGIGLGARRAGWLGATAIAGLVSLSTGIVIAVGTSPDLQKPDWRSVAEVLERGSANRVVVVNNHAVLGRPLLRYLPSSRELNDVDAVAVHEIDLLIHKPITIRCDWFVGRDCALIFLGGQLHKGLTDSFKLVRQNRVGNFTVARYESRGIVTLRRAEIATHEFGESLILVLPTERS